MEYMTGIKIAMHSFMVAPKGTWQRCQGVCYTCYMGPLEHDEFDAKQVRR